MKQLQNTENMSCEVKNVVCYEIAEVVGGIYWGTGNFLRKMLTVHNHQILIVGFVQRKLYKTLYKVIIKLV